MRAWSDSLADAVKTRSRSLGVLLFVLALTVFDIALLFGSAWDVGQMNIVHYIPQCTHGGKLLHSAWYHRDYCVAFGPVASVGENSTITEWGATVTGSYPAEMIVDHTPYVSRFFENPVPLLVISCIGALPLLIVSGVRVVNFMAELETNFVAKKREYEALSSPGEGVALTTTSGKRREVVHAADEEDADDGV
jgi:hypothetical protein